MAGRLQCACHVNTRPQQTNIDGRRLGAHLRAVRPRIGRLATGLRPGEPWKAPSLPSRKTPLNHPSFLRRLPHYDSRSIHSALSSKCHHHQLQETWGNAVCASPAWQNILSRRRRRRPRVAGTPAAILHLIFPSTLQQDERPGVKLPCNQSRASDGVHLSTSGSMDQFDRPDSTSSGGGWTQHQGRLMRLGLPLKRIPRMRASFVKPKKKSPPRSPMAAGSALARVSFVRPISVPHGTATHLPSQGTDRNPGDRRDAGDPGAGSPDMTAAELHHPHAFPSPAAGPECWGVGLVI